MALTISDLAATSGTDIGLLFTHNTTSNYKNQEGLSYKLTESGDLILCAGGFNYNGGTAGISPWKTQTLSDYSTGQPITLFYTYNAGKVTISAMQGDDTTTLTTFASLNGSGVQFGSNTMNQINFSAKGSSRNTWNPPNGVTGEYTLNNFDLYLGALTKDQMKEYALSAVPEPAAASLSLLGLGHAAGTPPQGVAFFPATAMPFPFRDGRFLHPFFKPAFYSSVCLYENQALFFPASSPAGGCSLRTRRPCWHRDGQRHVCGGFHPPWRQQCFLPLSPA